MTADARGDVGPVWHEAFTLPLVLLSAALLGGLRIDAAGGLAFVAPTLFALVLAVLLIAVLHRCGALDPARLVHPRRGGLANASGVVIVVALGAAAAQMIAALTPEEGLLALVFDVAWLVLIGNTLAARPDRPRLLSSLMVMFGAAFVVKFILLGALYAPNPSLTKRVVMALVEGVSLGALAYQPPGPATGYVTFASGLLFLAGIAALPHGREPGTGNALVRPHGPEPGAGDGLVRVVPGEVVVVPDPR